MLASVGLGALMAGGAVTIGAAPASAAWSDCTYDYACMWQSTDYPYSPNASFQYNIRQLTASNNLVNSVVNRGATAKARFFDGFDFTGAYFTLDREGNLSGAQWRDPYLANGTDSTTTPWSNRISSGKFV
ncbi:peptidase inhibitor family I36 protein [Georgenia yuyongxinii]